MSQQINLFFIYNSLYTSTYIGGPILKGIFKKPTQKEFLESFFPNIILKYKNSSCDTSKIWNEPSRRTKLMNRENISSSFLNSLAELLINIPELIYSIEANCKFILKENHGDPFLLKKIFTKNIKNDKELLGDRLYLFINNSILSKPEKVLTILLLFSIFGSKISSLNLYDDKKIQSNDFSIKNLNYNKEDAFLKNIFLTSRKEIEKIYPIDKLLFNSDTVYISNLSCLSFFTEEHYNENWKESILSSIQHGTKFKFLIPNVNCETFKDIINYKVNDLFSFNTVELVTKYMEAIKKLSSKYPNLVEFKLTNIVFPYGLLISLHKNYTEDLIKCDLYSSHTLGNDRRCFIIKRNFDENNFNFFYNNFINMWNSK